MQSDRDARISFSRLLASLDAAFNKLIPAFGKWEELNSSWISRFFRFENSSPAEVIVFTSLLMGREAFQHVSKGTTMSCCLR